MNHRVVASAVIYKDNHILIAKRAATKKVFPNAWEIPGGKVEVGESPQQALKREVKEELGIDIEVMQPLCVYSSQIGNEWWTEIDFVAVLLLPSQTITLNTHDHSDYAWINQSQIDEYFDETDNNGRAVRQAFQEL
ncbi:MAG TPA: NUDIX domain-containing protein [Patescibacteria group bacterium]